MLTATRITMKPVALSIQLLALICGFGTVLVVSWSIYAHHLSMSRGMFNLMGGLFCGFLIFGSISIYLDFRERANRTESNPSTY